MFKIINQEKLFKLVQPKNENEDLRRRELILNILLFFSIVCFTVINIIRLTDFLNHGYDRGLSVIYTLLILAFFIFLRWLSSRGKIKTASWLLIIIYALPAIYSLSAWGADLPAGLLLTILIVTLSGILINENLVIINTLAFNIFLVIMTRLHNSGIIKVNSYWRARPHELGDAIAYAVLSLMIASIAWLFCRQIERALQRARNSEAELKQERDQLEIKVKERTDQLRQAEAEKINQLYRLAEFGRLSSGIFHDLINPLTAVSLNLNQAKDETKADFSKTNSYINQAITAAHRMEGLVSGIKKQIQKESAPAVFSANEEIKQIIQILSYKSSQAKAAIIFRNDEEIKLYGDAIKFGQIVSNLLSNAIEASEAQRLKTSGEAKSGQEYNIEIEISLSNNTITMRVSDQGEGVAPENITKIFEPFFSTKITEGRGLGLGLSSTKNIVEKDFGGTISISSQPGLGSCFSVNLPIRKPHEN